MSPHINLDPHSKSFPASTAVVVDPALRVSNSCPVQVLCKFPVQVNK